MACRRLSKRAVSTSWYPALTVSKWALPHWFCANSQVTKIGNLSDSDWRLALMQTGEIFWSAQQSTVGLFCVKFAHLLPRWWVLESFSPFKLLGTLKLRTNIACIALTDLDNEKRVTTVSCLFHRFLFSTDWLANCKTHVNNIILYEIYALLEIRWRNCTEHMCSNEITSVNL